MDFEDYEKITKSLADVTYHLRRNWHAEDDDLAETFDRLKVEINYLVNLLEDVRNADL